ncbi:MAG TPA: rhodanese-like domain-containing protein [Pyrinomonadaceae bacterium]|nr:rhodanese-like domain-containing protein [Pyrinomonadaceae bacterium]
MQTVTDTGRATRHAGDGERRLTPLADNAFRLLGLSCHASQREIYASAAALRRAIKLGVAKTPAHQIGWLGSPDLTENDVRDALGRLSIPAQRIYERLFWFFDPQAAETTSLNLTSLRETSDRLRTDGSLSARHDIALISLSIMLRLDPALEHGDDWRRAYALWKELIGDKEFWSSLLAADLKGDFEQVATFAEIADLRARTWRLVTAPLKEMANDAVRRRDYAQAGRALALLGESGLPQALADEYEQEILGPVEDEFDVLLGEVFSGYRYEVKTDQSIGERRETCWRAHAKFNEQVKPALRKIHELAGAESAFARRAFAAAAQVLDELAEGFETAFDNGSRVKMLRKAWQLSPPESATLLLVEEHLAAAGDASVRQPKTDADYALQVRMALRETAAQPELFTSYIQKEETEKDLERWGRGAFRFIFFVMVALFVGKCFNSLPGSSRPYAYRPSNFNAPLPRFTPSRELNLIAPADFVTVGELRAKLRAKSVTLLHVGAKGEYETGHIPGALPAPEAELFARTKNLPKQRQLVLYCYCAEQEASRRAAGTLQALGFTRVSVLEGGYRAWLDAGFPVK